MNTQFQLLINRLEKDTEVGHTIDSAFKAFCIALEADSRIRKGLYLILKSDTIDDRYE